MAEKFKEKAPEYPKPALPPETLVELLKDRGVTFEHFSEKEAAEYLRHTNNFIRAASYRKLYPFKNAGRETGNYIGLDFAALTALASIDRSLRTAFKEITNDIEHFAHVELDGKCLGHGENGYDIVADYLTHLKMVGNARAVSTIMNRAIGGKFPDLYEGDLIAHYINDLGGLSVWTLLEVIEFGRFTDFWLFCAKRWGDNAMLTEHYVLRATKDLRNASCHNSRIVNGLSKKAEKANYTVHEPVASFMKEHGLKNTKSRRAKLNNLRVAQMAAALYADSRFCTRPSTRSRHLNLIDEVREKVNAAQPLFPADGSLDAYFNFIFKMVDVWLPSLP